MNRGAWWATVYAVAKSQTRFSDNNNMFTGSSLDLSGLWFGIRRCFNCGIKLPVASNREKDKRRVLRPHGRASMLLKRMDKATPRIKIWT